MNAFKMRKIQNWFFGKSAYKEFSIISSIFRVFHFFVESACPISPPPSWFSSLLLAILLYFHILCHLLFTLCHSISLYSLGLLSGFSAFTKNFIYLSVHTYIKAQNSYMEGYEGFFFFLSLGSPHILYFPNLPIYPKVLFFQHKEVFHVSKGISASTLLYFCKAGKSKFILE